LLKLVVFITGDNMCESLRTHDTGPLIRLKSGSQNLLD